MRNSHGKTGRKFQTVTDLGEMNGILAAAKVRGDTHIHWGPFPTGERLGREVYIDEGKVRLNVTIKRGGEACTYTFFLSDTSRTPLTTGARAYSLLARMSEIKIPKADCDLSSAGILWKNKRFDGKRVRAWSYDLNSSFSFQMITPMPDTRFMRMNDKVGKNEIGFYEGFNPYDVTPLDCRKTYLQLEEIEGKRAKWVCPLMPSPFKHFVGTYYHRKEIATCKEEREIAKETMNFAIGFLQRKNPFIRATIIGRSNKYISQFIDRETLYCNTDCIVSTYPRKDLEALCGDGLGQFKQEHIAEPFAWGKGVMNYQWGKNPPVSRGVPKAWYEGFKKAKGRYFDIIRDEVPERRNRYVFDRQNLTIKER